MLMMLNNLQNDTNSAMLKLMLRVVKMNSNFIDYKINVPAMYCRCHMSGTVKQGIQVASITSQ